MDEIIAKIVSEFEPGQLITHDYLRDIFNIKFPQIRNYNNTAKYVEDYQNIQFKYMQMVDNLRNELLEKEMYYLRNIRGDGYTLLPPKDQVQFGFNSAIDAIKKELKTARNIMLNVRTNAIPTEQVGKNNDLIARLSNLQQVFSSSRK